MYGGVVGLNTITSDRTIYSFVYTCTCVEAILFDRIARVILFFNFGGIEEPNEKNTL